MFYVIVSYTPYSGVLVGQFLSKHPSKELVGLGLSGSSFLYLGVKLLAHHL